jgi:hypothetical protein
MVSSSGPALLVEKKLNIEQQEPHYKTEELRCTRMVSSSGFALLVLERKLNIEQQEPHYKTEGNSGAPEW